MVVMRDARRRRPSTWGSRWAIKGCVCASESGVAYARPTSPSCSMSTYPAQLLEEEEDGQEARQREEGVDAVEARVGDEADARGEEAATVHAHGLARVGDPDGVCFKIHGVAQQDHEHAQHAHGVQAQEGPRAGRGREARVVAPERETVGDADDEPRVVPQQGDAGVLAVLRVFVL